MLIDNPIIWDCNAFDARSRTEQAANAARFLAVLLFAMPAPAQDSCGEETALADNFPQKQQKQRDHFVSGI